jgi:hypothetical protein
LLPSSAGTMFRTPWFTARIYHGLHEGKPLAQRAALAGLCI